MAKTTQYRKAINERQDKDKQILLNALKEMPIVAVTCQKVGIGTSTYYRWIKQDKEFSRQSGAAVKEGDRFLNDMAQSQTVSLMKDKYWPAIKYYLEHRHPYYMKKERAAEVEPKRITIEIIDYAKSNND